MDATILAERIVGAGVNRVHIAGRRDLATEEIYWHVATVGGGALDDPEVQRVVQDGIQSLRVDYGLGG